MISLLANMRLEATDYPLSAIPRLSLFVRFQDIGVMSLRDIVRDQRWLGLTLATIVVYMIPVGYLAVSQEFDPSILAVQLPLRIIVALVSAILMSIAVQKLRRHVLHCPVIMVLMLWVPIFGVPFIGTLTRTDLVASCLTFAAYGIVVGIMWDAVSYVYLKLRR